MTDYSTTLPNKTLFSIRSSLDLYEHILVERFFGSRVFYGTTTEESISRQIGMLWELLGNSGDVLQNRYMVAAYENPGVPQRRNEIWFIRRGPWTFVKPVETFRVAECLSEGVELVIIKTLLSFSVVVSVMQKT